MQNRSFSRILSSNRSEVFFTTEKTSRLYGNRYASNPIDRIGFHAAVGLKSPVAATGPTEHDVGPSTRNRRYVGTRARSRWRNDVHINRVRHITHVFSFPKASCGVSLFRNAGSVEGMKKTRYCGRGIEARTRRTHRVYLWGG
jgi:hypothetical protein